MMVPAAEQLKELLQGAGLQAPQKKVYANVTAEDIMSGFDGGDAGLYLAGIMARQAMNPVYWEETVEHFRADGTEALIEIGPGKTLSGLAKKIAPGMHRFYIENTESLEKTIAGLQALIKGGEPC